MMSHQPDDCVATTDILLAQAHAHSPAALPQIYVRYRERLECLARTYLASCPFPVVSAQDAAQSALLSFHERFDAGQFPDLHDRDSLWSLLATITRRKVLQAVRREQRQKRGGSQVQTSAKDAVDCEPLSREPDPAEPLMENELQNLLFQRLTDTNRQIAWLRLAGRTIREIAEQLNRTEKAIERRLDTIRAEIKRLEEAD